MQRGLFAASLIILFCGSIIWAKTLSALRESSNGYTLEFEVSQYTLEVVDKWGLVNTPFYAGEMFVRARVPEYKFTEDVGKPQLPVFTFFMALTDINNVPTFEVLNPLEEIVPLDINYFPAQEPWYKNQTIADRTFSIDEEYYASRGIRAPIAEVKDVFTTRGVPCVMITVAPFFYNPVEKKLTVTKKCTLKITTSTANKYTGLDSKVFENFLRHIVVNFESAVEPVRSNREEDYLIITAPDYEADLANDFVPFRKNRFNVTMVTTGTAGSSASQIQSYIKGLHPTPAFLLLVGDTDKIPVSSGIRATTDIYYSSTEGDYKPEILLGRFSVSSSSELSYIIAKTIHMEENLGSIAKRILFIGGVDRDNGYIAERTHNYVIDRYTESAGYENIKKYCNSNNVTKTEVMDEINEGVIFNVYSGHGGSSGWGAGDFSLNTRDLDNMTNTTSYPFTYGFACQTGTYTNNECFSEACIRVENGPVTGCGSTISTAWGPDETIEEGIFDGIFDDQNPVTTVSASLNAGKMKNASRQYWECYNLMGDPALEVFPINLDPFISVSSPNGGEEWEQGKTYDISWNDNIDGNVKIELYKGGSLKETLTASTESDGSHEWEITTDFETGDDYKVKITSVDSTALNDESDENFSVTPEYIVQCPYFQNFDILDTGKTTLPEKYEQRADDDFDWIVLSGETPSRRYGTGPTGDHTTGNGNYVYVEASGENYPNKKTAFETPKFNFKSLSNPTLTFWAHMKSDSNTMGDLYIDISVDGVWENDVIHLENDHGDSWFEVTQDLSSYVGDRVIFRFRGITGSLWCSDMCIDDFEITGATGTGDNGAPLSSFFDLKFYGSRVYYSIPPTMANHPLRIDLYTMKGTLVKTVVDNRVNPGSYHIPVKNIAAGLYILKMETKGFKKTMNILLNK